MLLQLAIDCFTLQEAVQIVEETADVIDIVEAGTPLILREGIGAVQNLRSRFSSLRIAADMKIIDGAEYESRLAFDAGADIVTVLGAAENQTIHLAKRTAEEYGREVMVDMIGISDVAERARELSTRGVDCFCVHLVTDLDVPGISILDELSAVRGVVSQAKIAIAGGINLHILQSISGAKPDIAIVGSAITKSENRREAALTIKNSIN